MTNPSPKVSRLDELADEGNRLHPEPLFGELFLAEDEAKTEIAVRNFIPIDFHSLKFSPLAVLQFLFWNHRKIQGRWHLALHGFRYCGDLCYHLPDRQS